MATRIQKVLSDQGILSRRKAEEYIAAGRITVNGHPAKVGHPINPRRDIIAIDGVRVQFARKKQNVYLALNKPRGYVTTTSDELGRKCITDLVADMPEKVYPVGRLDKLSEGIILMTNDGNFANMVMHPSHNIKKTYRATVRGNVTEEQVIKLSTGLDIGNGERTAPASVLVLEKSPQRTVLQITIEEGKNRQIRRMCEAVNLEVARLRRTTVGPVKLGMLQPGKWRELTPAEVAAVKNAAGSASNQLVPGRGASQLQGARPTPSAKPRGGSSTRPRTADASKGRPTSASKGRPTGASKGRTTGGKPRVK